MKKIVTIILFGSIWGMLEAIIGGALHVARVPFTGMIMSAIGFALLYTALRLGVRPANLFAVSLVAASFKFLDPILFKIAFFDITVINPAVAIASQGLAFSAIFSVFRLSSPSALIGDPEKRPYALALRFLATAAIAMAAFNLISLGVFGWPTNHTINLANAIFIQLPLTAILASAFALAINKFSDFRINSIMPRWQIAGSAACVMLSIGARIVMH